MSIFKTDSKKLRNYHNSGLNIISYVLEIILLLAATIFSFAVMNYGLFKTDPQHFRFQSVPSFSSFIYYSYNSFLFNSMDGLTSNSLWSQILNMAEWSFSLFLGVIFVSLFFSVSRQKYSEELNEVVKNLEYNGSEMEKFIQDEYRINSIEDAIAELEKLKAVFIKFIFKITEGIK